jgi:iron complex transport system permease protein
VLLVGALLAALAAGVLLGEAPLSASQYAQGFADPNSPAGQILWSIRAPRAGAAALVGAALGLAGAVMQGLLRNPLADPGVLGVSAGSGLFAAVAVAAGLGGVAGPWRARRCWAPWRAGRSSPPSRRGCASPRR